MPILKEFKTFIMRGNVVDMAVGIIIGASFSGIVNSLVNDVIMPPIAFLTKNVDFTNSFLVLRKGTDVAGHYATLTEAKAAAAVTLNYGLFLNSFVAFLIVALVVFFLIRAMNRLKRKEEIKPTEPPKPSNEEALLAEIRDLLKK